MKRRWRDGRGRDDYSREAIILYISVKGGDYPGEAINRGTAIIRGNTAVNTSTMSLKSWDAI